MENEKRKKVKKTEKYNLQAIVKNRSSPTKAEAKIIDLETVAFNSLTEAFGAILSITGYGMYEANGEIFIYNPRNKCIAVLKKIVRKNKRYLFHALPNSRIEPKDKIIKLDNTLFESEDEAIDTLQNEIGIDFEIRERKNGKLRICSSVLGDTLGWLLPERSITEKKKRKTK